MDGKHWKDTKIQWRRHTYIRQLGSIADFSPTSKVMMQDDLPLASYKGGDPSQRSITSRRTLNPHVVLSWMKRTRGKGSKSKTKEGEEESWITKPLKLSRCWCRLRRKTPSDRWAGKKDLWLLHVEAGKNENTWNMHLASMRTVEFVGDDLIFFSY